MAELQDLQSAVDFFEEFSENISPYIEWTKSNWLTIVLTGEIHQLPDDRLTVQAYHRPHGRDSRCGRCHQSVPFYP